jgi:hypothetical protein
MESSGVSDLGELLTEFLDWLPGIGNDSSIDLDGDTISVSLRPDGLGEEGGSASSAYLDHLELPVDPTTLDGFLNYVEELASDFEQHLPGWLELPNPFESAPPS